MGKIDTVLLDKTGTVTRGDFSLVEVSVLEAKVEALAMSAAERIGPGCAPSFDAEEQFLSDTLPKLAGIEAYSEHLLGRALVQYRSRSPH
jgi:cation transport ATPase